MTDISKPAAVKASVIACNGRVQKRSALVRHQPLVRLTRHTCPTSDKIHSGALLVEFTAAPR